MNMMEGLMQCAANYVPLTPISFLERAARVYPNQNSLVCGKLTFTWKQTHERCMKLASSLSSHGLSYGDFVVALIPNILELYELHFGVAMAGGVLCTLNPRLDTTTLSSILEDINPKFIFLDHQNIHPFNQALNNTTIKLTHTPVLVVTSSFPKQKTPPNSLNYNDLLDMVHNNFEPKTPKNECDPILVNYTSGSTGHPKGVAYSHRATYLNTLGEVFRSNLRENSKAVFLWTADMFRANGWGFIWAIAAVGGTNVIMLRTMNNDNDFCNILKSICFHKVTHLSGHPHLLSTIIEEHNTTQLKIPHKVYAHVAGVIQASSDDLVKIQHLGFEVVHRYGMTEILGPPLILNNNNNKCSWNHNNHSNMMEEFDIKDPTTMESVPLDGKTIGEVMFRGNALMMGYFKCLKETEKVFSRGWFHTGDLALRHQDGCIQLKDRVLDAIVVVSSQGKTVIISSLEIEAVLLTHPKVQQAAVVAMPLTHHHHHHHYDDDHNDDDDDEVVVPCAFLKLKIGCDATQKEIIQFCSERLPNHMVPRVVNFGNLAVSSTGKVQKFILREAAKLLSINMSSNVTTPIELNS